VTASEPTGRSQRHPGDEHRDEHRDEHHVDIGQFIRSQREIARMSVRRLAEVAGVSNPYLSQIERGIRKPSAEILQQLAAALRISVETLYVHAGFLQPRHEGTSTVPEAIDADPRLTPEQKRALLGVYRSYVDAGGSATPRH
jgi:transcriptional regulator with XRE-family HTH domain